MRPVPRTSFDGVVQERMVLHEKKVLHSRLGRSMYRSRGPLVWLVGFLLLLISGHWLIGRGWPLFSSILHREWLEDVVERARPKVVPAYSAGAYMAGHWPRNVTSCQWYYGLPHVLAYSTSETIRSPDSLEYSLYRVLPFVIRGHSNWKQQQLDLPPLTLCTHATSDQVYAIVDLVRRWEGPLSLAIFTPGLDAELAIALLDRACRCEPAMFKVSVHLIFPMNLPPVLDRASWPQGDCTASDLQQRQAETQRKKSNLEYPINVARNVARTQACTFRVLVSDIELLPSQNLASGFLEMVRGRPLRIGVVFVVPVFEIESSEEPPGTKDELLRALRAGLAFYFHRFLCPHCQRFPGLIRWTMSPDPGRVRPFIVTRREFPHHRWEPVFIGTRQDPFYTENMSWEGRQDKMAQMFEMCVLNYRFVVLDGAFLVHTPGIKRKPLHNHSERFARLCERRNARIYQNVIRHLLKQYPTNRRCRR